MGRSKKKKRTLFLPACCEQVGPAVSSEIFSHLLLSPFVPGLSTVEVFGHKSNEWLYVASMNTRRSSVGVGVVDGKAWATPTRVEVEQHRHSLVFVFLQVSCTQSGVTMERLVSVSARWKNTTRSLISGATWPTWAHAGVEQVKVPLSSQQNQLRVLNKSINP